MILTIPSELICVNRAFVRVGAILLCLVGIQRERGQSGRATLWPVKAPVLTGVCVMALELRAHPGKAGI